MAALKGWPFFIRYIIKQMKASILRKPAPIETRPLDYAEVADPIAEGEFVTVRVSACGVCRTDLHVTEGDLEIRKSPIIPGHQVVGTVDEIGGQVSDLSKGDRVGIAWLNHTDGICRFCTSGRENLCENADFTGWTQDGGYAEVVRAPATFVYRLPDGFSDLQAAPLLCAGIIGYRSLKLTNALRAGARIGIYGFGAAGHVCIQIAEAHGVDVYVATRDRERHQSLAEDLGAKWVGDTFDVPPVSLDAAIIFAPAGEIVPAALKALDKGGSLVLGGIHMSPIPEFEYSLLYGERIVRSVANNTRGDGHEFLEEAAKIGIKTSVQEFPLNAANDALIALKNDAIRGAAVLKT
jgi:propanol-preferring alcohol dehydrogenase